MEQKPKESANKPKKRTAGNYGSLNFMDYLIPDKDPDLEFMEQENDEQTLKRYTHNRKKVYTWQQTAVLAGTAALAIGGTLMGGVGSQSLLGEIALFTGAPVAALFSGALIGLAVAGVIAFTAGYIAFRTDIKNDVDIEEMQAKRIGKYVGNELNKLQVEQEAEKRLGKAPGEDVVIPNQGTPHTKVKDAVLLDRVAQQMLQQLQ